jgi:hypothetical protein
MAKAKIEEIATGQAATNAHIIEVPKSGQTGCPLNF